MTARDYSDQYPTYSNSFVELFLSWDGSQNVEVAITVKDIPGGKIAKFDRLNQYPDPEIDYEYLFSIIPGGNVLSTHDQSFLPYHLTGTPKSVRAGFTGQGSASRANAVAL